MPEPITGLHIKVSDASHSNGEPAAAQEKGPSVEVVVECKRRAFLVVVELGKTAKTGQLIRS